MLESHPDDPARVPAKFAQQLLHPKRALTKVGSDLVSLYRAPSPNTRFLITTGAFWTVFLAATEPYKTLFFQTLGYDNKAIGILVSLDMVVRASGLGLSGFFMRRFGAKRMLVGADIVSWVLPYLILGLATRPWHIMVAVLCTSLNAFASTPYNCMMAQGMPPERRTRAYAFLHLWNIAPSVVVPWIAGYFVSGGEFLPAVRSLFLAQAASMAVGIFLRWRKLEDLQKTPDAHKIGFFTTLASLVRSAPFLAAWTALASQWVFSQVWNSFLPIFLTKHLSQPVKMPALMNEAGAIGFLVGSMILIPRLSESRMRSLAPFGLLMQTGFVLLFSLHPTMWGLLALSGFGGICSSLYLGATSAILTHSLPENLRDHGFSVSYIGAFLLSAITMPMVGQELRDNLGSFPYLAGVGLLLWMIMLGVSDRLLKRSGI